MTVLKKDFESTFKEGFRLGVRLVRAKILYAQAADARQLGDIQMSEFYVGAAKQWSDLAHNAGRKFCPEVALEPEQPVFDFGDPERLIDNKPDEVDVRKVG